MAPWFSVKIVQVMAESLTRNKFQWNVHQDKEIFIQENAFEKFECRMVAFFSGFKALLCPPCSIPCWPPRQEPLILRLLHSLSSVVIGQSVGYEALPLWLADINADWDTPQLHWILGFCNVLWGHKMRIYNIFQKPLIIPLHSPNGRQIACR